MEAPPMMFALFLIVTAAAAVFLFASEASDTDGHTNRLAEEASPYLQQHAHNPVDWYPWGEQAKEKARREDKPIFLSVGYSTCHWCHVMAHESFENEEVAAILNEHYVPVKVDREERPDIDAQYMLATQMFTGRGGWPNSVWLTPDGRPWLAGTYFPREDQGNRAGFKTILRRLAEVWQTQRDEIEAQADKFATAINQYGGSIVSEGQPLSEQMIHSAVAAAQQEFDAQNGGFGGAPKFPPHSRLALLVHRCHETGDEPLKRIVIRTVDGMAMGGVHDHVGGGFHRYSTDARWFLPHFEKMLYDNGQLLGIYADAFVLTRHEPYRRIADDLVGWVQREMTDERGGFYSAIDADSEGEEGKYYVWSQRELIDVLGEEDGELFCEVYGVKPDGNWTEEATGHHPGTNVLHLPGPVSAVAERHGMESADLRDRLATMRAKLLPVRMKRIAPHLDDKVLASWNGLMIAGLAHAGQALDRPNYLELAGRAADFVLDEMRDGERLLRYWRHGQAGQPAYLDDYAFFIDGLLELHAATDETRWRDAAASLADVMVGDFFDEEAGGFFFTSPRHDELIARSKDPQDSSIPSGNGVAMRVLPRLTDLTGDERYLDAARKCFRAFSGLMNEQPQAVQSMIHAYAMHRDALALEAKPAESGEQPVARQREGPVLAELFLAERDEEPAADASVRLTIEDGWHLYGHSSPARHLQPTEIALADDAALSLSEVNYPAGETIEDPVSQEQLPVYRGQVTIRGTLRLNEDAQEASGVIEIHAQPCDQSRCLEPQRFTLPFTLDIAQPQ